MHTIGAVFRTRAEAIAALQVLAKLAMPQSKLGILTPGRDATSLGEGAVVSVIPGIGPAVGVGELGTPLALTTTRAGEHVDTFFEAVRRGHSVVIVLVRDEDHASHARDSLFSVGESLEDARRRWEDEAQVFALAAEILRPSAPSIA